MRKSNSKSFLTRADDDDDAVVIMLQLDADLFGASLLIRLSKLSFKVGLRGLDAVGSGLCAFPSVKTHYVMDSTCITLNKRD
jgi:hypothetical protein